MRVLILATLAALTVAFPLRAEPSNPRLVSTDYAAGAQKSQNLQIQKLDITVTLIAGLAQTTVEATFANPTSRALEGDFTMALPAGAVVNGYALDVHGRMVDGVPTGKRQAKLAYEARVRAGVDPGVAEVTDDNAFRTRVFPIFPGSGRTVRLSYVSPLAADGSFSLPIVTDAPVPSTHVQLVLSGALNRPRLQAPKGMTLAWESDGIGRLVAAADVHDLVLNSALQIGPWRQPELELSRDSNGERFFALQFPYAARPAAVGRLRVYWDRSRSRRDDDLKAEIALLTAYVDVVHPDTIELVTFADAGPEAQVLSGPGAIALETALRGLTYGGASSLKGLFEPESRPADVCLFVSDGRMTLDPWSVRRLPCRTFTVTSAADANRDFLSTFAQASGGSLVDLTATPASAALASLTTAGPPAFELADANGQPVQYRQLAGPAGRYWIIGKTPASSALNFVGKDGVRRRFELDSDATHASDAVGAMWGREIVADLLTTDRPDRDEALRTARQYNIATGEAAFVVMESAADYADAGASPPASAGDEMIAAYQAVMRQRKQEEAQAREARFDQIIELWTDEQKAWRQTYVARPKPKGGGGPAPPPPRLQPRPPVAAPNVPTMPPLAAPPVQHRLEEPRPPAPGASAAPSEVVVTALRRHGQAHGRGADKEVVVKGEAWNPDRPYLVALAQAAPDKYWSIFADQEREYGDAPAFYFDVAEALFQAGRPIDARRVALNTLDLPRADTRTLIVLAERMQRYGDWDRAIWLYERVLFLEPDRPQPRRDLALALIARADARAPAEREADYREALKLLNEVITRTWSTAYDGIEVISLMEANHLIAKMKTLGMSQSVLDRRLIALLNVDIRVILEWNTDATDMDLWVDEPTGERAIYNNPRTAIGGRLSNDMTAGFGPEQYILRRAPSGLYKVRVNTYATDRLDPNGPTVVRVTLFRGWGRPDEKIERFETELKREEGAISVGRFVVARQPQHVVRPDHRNADKDEGAGTR